MTSLSSFRNPLPKQLYSAAWERKSPTHNISIPLDDMKFGEADVKKFVTEILVPENTFGDKTEEAREKVYDFYLSDHDDDEKDYRYYVKKYTQVRWASMLACFHIPSVTTHLRSFRHSCAIPSHCLYLPGPFK